MANPKEKDKKQKDTTKTNSQESLKEPQTEEPVNIDLEDENQSSPGAEGEAPKGESPEDNGPDTSSEEGADGAANPDGTANPDGAANPDKKDKAQLKIDELNDRLMRQMAEFENFRKRSEKEKAQMFETGAKSIIEKILPVVDNFERGLAAIPEDQEKDSFTQGMEMVYRQLMQELEGLGVTPIEAVGQEFNPEFHNAVMQTQSEEYESGIIAQELLKGYMYRESVVRHSMVAVVE